MKMKFLFLICICTLFSINLSYARWPQVDPHAENYYSQSPYSFAGNNSVNNIDPDGRDYYQSTGGAVIWQDNNARTIMINKEKFRNIGPSFSIGMGDGTFANYYQNQFVSTSLWAIDAGLIVLENEKLAGMLLSLKSSLSDLSRLTLMTDLVRKAQLDFINHPITQVAINTLLFVATGGVEGVMALGETAGSLIARKAIKSGIQAVEAGQYNITRTVANKLTARPYINSPSTITNVMRSSQGVPDAFFKGGINYTTPGTFNGAQGMYELGINPRTRTIYHFLFKK